MSEIRTIVFQDCIEDWKVVHWAWESDLKAEYDNSCASCGTKENEPHRYFKRKVVLEKGHMDPRKDMSMGNIIPQCNFCNKHYGNKYVFDRMGRVVESL